MLTLFSKRSELSTSKCDLLEHTFGWWDHTKGTCPPSLSASRNFSRASRPASLSFPSPSRSSASISVTGSQSLRSRYWRSELGARSREYCSPTRKTTKRCDGSQSVDSQPPNKRRGILWELGLTSDRSPGNDSRPLPNRYEVQSVMMESLCPLTESVLTQQTD